MRKLVVLKLDGDFEQQGFRVTLEIGEESARPETEITANLPPAPELPSHYDRWQLTYRSLGTSVRIKSKKIVYDGSINKRIEDCTKSAQLLRDRLNFWLNSESFRPLREKWLEQLSPSEEVRVLIRTPSMQLRQLPWHLWDLVERYPKAEVALSAFDSERPAKVKLVTPKKQIKILAILGNSAGIDVNKDRQLLEEFDAETTFLVEPDRKKINEHLWEQPWDILFFAGHSKTEGETGRIYINQTDSLTIDELKYGLKTAIAHGLQLAIFNSCQGLGLAQNLASLHIPQIIVMREPVPDLIAQEFLKHFLTAFAGGESLYLAVRKARERLHGLEDKFPNATWLPVICQHPTEVPPTWQELLPKINSDRSPVPRKIPLQTAFVASVFVTCLIIIARSVGMLQTWELQTYDHLMRQRLILRDEGQDNRLLIVKVTENDINQLKEYPLSDATVVKLLKKLEEYQPRVIGLDIYRDLPQEPGYAEFVKYLQQSDRFIAVCKGSGSKDDPGIKLPNAILKNIPGFTDVVRDFDGIIRRHLLAANIKSSRCQTDKSFNLQLARRYLADEGIQMKLLESEEYFKLGNVVFKTLEKDSGGYYQLNTLGHKVLLNYRSTRQIAAEVNITQVLNNQIDPNLVKNRIIIIGTTAESVKDYFFTPYSAGHSPIQEMSGVMLHAHMVSQIVSAVKDGRSLIWVLPKLGEAFWILFWSIVGGMLIQLPSKLRLLLAYSAAGGTLYALCFVWLLAGGWIPLIPPALALVTTGGLVVIYTDFQNRKLHKKDISKNLSSEL